MPNVIHEKNIGIYEYKVKTFLKMISNGTDADEAAMTLGYKSFDSMRGTMGCENGFDLRKSMAEGKPVKWVRMKNIKKATQDHAISESENGLMIMTVSELKNKLLEAVHIIDELTGGENG